MQYMGFQMHRPAFPKKISPKAQGLLEFALALPILLLLVFGIIEFGRLLQAWLALENGARFGVRYAITGEYNRSYCDEAAAVVAPSFGLTTAEIIGKTKKTATSTVASPPIPHPTSPIGKKRSSALQDWARLPSIRDTVMAGATGVSWRTASTGDYIAYLSNPSSTFNQANRGNPSLPGYLDISICSSRSDQAQSSYFRLNGTGDSGDPVQYFDNIADTEHQFPLFCGKANYPTTVSSATPMTPAGRAIASALRSPTGTP